MPSGTNMTARAVADLPLDDSRRYLFIVAITNVVVTIYDDDSTAGTPFTIPADGHWAPIPAPINKITLTGTGTVTTG